MKLLCKKNPDKSIKITPGKYYHFKDMIVNWYSSLNDNSLTFYLSDNPESELYIWNYFYTPQQIRKIKLEKLNEITL